MAELVDALGSGPSGSNPLEVRVLFWAPVFKDSPFLVKGFLVFCHGLGVKALSKRDITLRPFRIYCVAHYRSAGR